MGEYGTDLSVFITALNFEGRWMVSIAWMNGSRMNTTGTLISFQMVSQILSCVNRGHAW